MCLLHLELVDPEVSTLGSGNRGVANQSQLLTLGFIPLPVACKGFDAEHSCSLKNDYSYKSFHSVTPLPDKQCYNTC